MKLYLLGEAVWLTSIIADGLKIGTLARTLLELYIALIPFSALNINPQNILLTT